MRCHCSPADSHPSKPIRVELTFDRESLHLHETPFGTRVDLQGAKSSGEIGAPALPRFIIRVAVPPLQWPTMLEVAQERYVQVTREPVFIAPVQPLQPGALRPNQPRDERSDFPEPFPAPRVVPPDAKLYETAIRAPRPTARALSIETVGTTRMARIELNPVRQNAAGQLELCTHCEILVSFSEERPLADKDAAVKALEARVGRPIDPERVQPAPEPVITSKQQATRLGDVARSLVVNAESVKDIDLHRAFLELPAEYLIITDDQGWNAETIKPGGAIPGLVAAFGQLAAWKRSRGVTTKVVTITDIVGGRYGDFRSGSRDLQEVIRKFLKRVVPDWGVSWLLLGGDVDIVPIRQVAGAREGDIAPGPDNPPKDNTSFWTGSFLKMNVVNPGTWWPGLSPSSILVNPANGQLIPYDAAGTSNATNPGWYFTRNRIVLTPTEVDHITTRHAGAETEAGAGADPFAVQTTGAGTHVRVNGPASLVNTTLHWLYEWNMIPTDLYYASLASFVVAQHEIDFGFGLSFTIPYVFFPEHDWDAVNNGLYGQHNSSGDLDGVVLTTDVSVGRAPVGSATEAGAMVKKIIAYESFHSPDNGLRLDPDWPRRVVMASSNWGGPTAAASSTAADPPGDGQYHHANGAKHSVIKLAQPMAATNLTLIAEVSETDRRIMPYSPSAGDGGRGWHFAASANDLSVSEFVMAMPWGAVIRFPLPSPWVAVFGPADELTPDQYLLLDPAQDGSMSDQEQLRLQLRSELPNWDSYTRLYEDDVDLTPAQAAAAPVQHLTSARLQAALDAKPHIMSLSGHGNSDGCCGGSTWLASNLTNGYETFIGYADSCLTNQIDASDAFSEALVCNDRGGAVAYVGNTRFSWISLGDNFQRAFFHRLTTVDHLGLLNDSRFSLLGTGYWADERWTMFALNLMGDPEMKVRKKPLRHISISVRDTVVKNLERTPIVIKVIETKPPKPVPDPPPLANALVHVSQGETTLTARTDAAGEARLDLSPLEAGDVTLTVSLDGFVPFQIRTRITGPAWTRGIVTEITHPVNGEHRSLIRLRGDVGDRRFYVSAESGDAHAILNAAEHSFIAQEAISLWVTDVDDGGIVEGFHFVHPASA